MSKVLIVLMAGVFALTLSKVAASGDTDENSPQLQPVHLDDPAAGGAIASQREWEYLTALQKCESLAGADKTRCIDVAKEKYGEL